MKLVRLNRRHKAHRDLGHQWAFRWDSFNFKTCSQVEKIMQGMHGSQYRYNVNPVWKSGFGHAPRGSVYRTFWISFVNESDASVVLLQVQQ